MPIVIPSDLPAYEALKKENIFIMNNKKALVQDIRAIEIAILNLMPTKEQTETQLIRLLSNSPLQVNLTLVSMETYQAKNTCSRYLDKFYVNFSQIKDKKYDGLIITGAPVENFEFEDVAYWSELKKILDFTRTHATSSIFICWGAMAALKHFYNIDKVNLDEKMFGIYEYKASTHYEPLFKGLDDEFLIPMSRNADMDLQQIKNEKNLKILAQNENGASILKSKNGKEIYLFGHSEYDRHTLQEEYERDLKQGLDTKEPVNYFDENKKPKNNWSSTANLLFYNWINYYVYQITPYNIEEI